MIFDHIWSLIQSPYIFNSESELNRVCGPSENKLHHMSGSDLWNLAETVCVPTRGQGARPKRFSTRKENDLCRKIGLGGGGEGGMHQQVFCCWNNRPGLGSGGAWVEGWGHLAVTPNWEVSRAHNWQSLQKGGMAAIQCLPAADSQACITHICHFCFANPFWILDFSFQESLSR